MTASDLLRALDLLQAGEWNGAHAIAKADSSDLGSWCHGIVHMVEPDRGNSMYWYHRARRPFPGMSAADAEIEALRAELTGSR